VRARSDEARDPRLEDVDPGVDLALDGGLLLDPRHPVAVALDAAERDRVQVAARADGRREAAAGVEGEHGLDIDRGDQVAVEQQHRAGRWSGQQAERAGRAQGLALAQVPDRGPEGAPVAEVVLDDVGEVADRDEDPLDAEAHQVEHDPLEDRAARHASIGLGQCRSGRSGCPVRPDQRPVVAGRGLEEAWSR
jgi:hypothetical protein